MATARGSEPNRALGAAVEVGESVPQSRGWLRTLIPWTLGGGIVAYLFTQVPLADAWTATRSADLPRLALASIGAVTFWFWVESGAFAYLFSRFHVPFTWLEARSLRASTYVLTPINWNLGTAAIILYLRQSKGLSAVEATSTMLLYGTIDALVLSALTFVGLTQLPWSPELAQFQRAAATVFASLLAFLVLMGHGPAWGWLARMRAVSVLRSYGLAGWREIATLAGMRAAYFSVFALYFWAGSTAFHVDLPLAVSTATVALILLAQFIPLTPGGLGTTQAAMLYLWEPYGPEAGILAFALAFPVCITVSRVLLGLLYVRDIRGRLRKGR